MFVRMSYTEYGLIKGFTLWVQGKRNLLKRLNEMGISLDWIDKLEIQKKGETVWKEYDVSVLEIER